MDITSKVAIFRDGLLSMEWEVDRMCRRAITVQKCANIRTIVSRTSAVIPN